MSIDQNGQYRGRMFGKDRQGHTTPDLEASGYITPWLPCPYPAPYLPTLRQDQGHPVLASLAFSSQMLVGQDKSGALVPAGLRSGPTGNGSGIWCILKYSSGNADEFVIDPRTGNNVTPGSHVVLACPTDAVAGNVTLEDGTVVAVSSADITFALACTLFPTGVARPIGVVQRNVLQYIGGVTVFSTTGGITYRLDGNVPIKFQMLNFMYEMGTAIRTQYMLRVPWIGATPSTLTTLATTDGVQGFSQGYGRTFTHYTGTPVVGGGVTFSTALGDAGNYSDFDPSKNSPVDLIGRIHGVVNAINKIGYANRVKTLFDPSRMGGPIADPNPVSIMMGGSATAGLPYELSLPTDGIYKAAKMQNKPIHPEYGTFVLVRVNL